MLQRQRFIHATSGPLFLQAHGTRSVCSYLLHHRLATQVLRRLLLFGFTSDARSLEPVPAVSVCAPAMLQAVQAMQALRPARAPKSQLLAMMDRGVLKLVKTLAQIQETHPWCVAAGLYVYRLLSGVSV